MLNRPRWNPMYSTRTPTIAAALPIALLLLAACNGGGGGDEPSAAAQTTGSVAVLLTDGPVDPDEFKNIFLTYTRIILIGEPGQVTVFRGRETVDLRDLEDVSKLVTVGRRVPAGFYEKIRLEVEEIVLVPADGSDPVYPKLPPKVDLNPQGGFFVKPGKLLVLQIDMDAGKSIHIVETGNGELRFRPVVFIDIITGPFRGKLVLLEGRIEEIDLAEGTFLLCDTHSVSRPEGGDRASLLPGDGDPKDVDDFCIEVVVDSDTSIFDEAGDPVGLAALMQGDDASVLGRFMRDDAATDFGEKLVFVAEVVQLGEVTALDGVVVSKPDEDGRFIIELDPGQGIVTDDGTLAVQLQEGTKIFRRRGAPLEPEDILVGDPVRVVGVLVLSTAEDFLKASVVVIDMSKLDTERIEGTIVEILSGGARLEVETDDGTVCVDVSSDDRIVRVTVDDDGARGDPIDRSDLEVGDEVNVFGVANGCFSADTIIVFEGAEITPVPAAAAGFTAGAFGTAIEDDEEDGASGALLAPTQVEVFEFGPRRIEAGLIWAKLPEDSPDDTSPEAR